MRSKTILSLDLCGEDVAPLVGGKALGLGALLRSGLAVPPGFVVTTEAYRSAIKEAGIGDRIDDILAAADPAGDFTAASAEIAALFVDELITPELRDAVEKTYAELGMSKPVAVRSSAIAEDRADASFAGQQDTFLWVQGSDAVLSHIVRCWASLFSPRVIAYRARLQVRAEDVAMAVVVQEMVPARAAGVMMTLDPASGDRSALYVESAYGLGEAVVAGEVTPDAFWVEKDTLTLRRRVVGEKQVAYRFDEAIQEVSKVDVPAEERALWSLEPDEVRQLAQLGKDIEIAFGQPMDVEWAVAGSGSSSAIHLLQARPETVWASQPEPDLTGCRRRRGTGSHRSRPDGPSAFANRAGHPLEHLQLWGGHARGSDPTQLDAVASRARDRSAPRRVSPRRHLAVRIGGERGRQHPLHPRLLRASGDSSRILGHARGSYAGHHE